MSNYYKEQQTKLNLKIRDMLKHLPLFVREFINGIADTTTARTRLSYVYDLGIFLNYLANEGQGFGTDIMDFTLREMESISSAQLDDYKVYLDFYIRNNAKSIIETVNHAEGKSRKLSTLRTFYKYFLKKEKITRNPTDFIDLPKLSVKSIVRLEYNEVAKLLDIVDGGDGLTERQKIWHYHTKTRDAAIITVLLGMGIRVSECVGIDITHLDFENGGIYITRKGGGQALIYFGDEVEFALNKYMDMREEIHAQPGHQDALFLSMQNRRIDVRTVQKLVKKYSSLVTAHKNITPHKLRSTYGTNLYRETGDIYLVADVLGHKNIETTRKHYAEQSDENRRKAARAVKLRDD